MSSSATPAASQATTEVRSALEDAVSAVAAAASAVVTPAGFSPMVRDPALFPLATDRRPIVPSNVGAFATRVNQLNAAPGDRPGVTRPQYPGASYTPSVPATPPVPKFDAVAFMAGLPEETRALYLIEGRHDVIAPLMTVAVYSDEDFKHAVENTAYKIIYRCYLTGGFMVHIKRQFGTYLQMPVKTLVEDKLFKPRFKAGEGRDNLAELGGELAKKNMTFGDFEGLIKAAGVSADKFYAAIGHEGFKPEATSMVKRELDLAGWFPEGRKPSVYLLKQVVKLFREVCKRGNSALEAHIMIVWIPSTTVDDGNGTVLTVPGRYEVRVPTQRVSGASVSYEHDAYNPDTELCVIDIHSHNNMGAFYSGTDDNDDKNKVLITGVVGKLSQKDPDIVFRMNRFGDKHPLTVDMVFAQDDEDVQINPEWMSRIQTNSYGGYGGAAGNFRGGHNVTGYNRGGKGRNTGYGNAYDDEVYGYALGHGLMDPDYGDPVGGNGSKKEVAGAAQANAPVAKALPSPVTASSKPPALYLIGNQEEAEAGGNEELTLFTQENEVAEPLSDEQYVAFVLDKLGISADELVSIAKSPANVTADTWNFLAEIIDNEITSPEDITLLLEEHFKGAKVNIIGDYAMTLESLHGITSSDALLVQVIKEARDYLGAEGQVMLQDVLFGNGV